jgi:hypothetical protein
LERCAELGVEVLSRPIATVENGFVRHHAGHLARELILLQAERGIRIAGDRFGDPKDFKVEKQAKPIET